MVIALVLISGIALGQAEKLPAEATTLIKKLQDWELEKQIDLKAEVQEKRLSVAEVLKQHLEAATKRGDLDGAIAIREAIRKLTAEASDATTSDPSKGAEENWLVGTRWKVTRENLGKFELEFFEGKLKASTDSRFFEYKLSGTGTLTYKGLFREITLRFNKDQKSGIYSDDKGTKGTIILIEK